ncbi:MULTISPECIES: hypothetical protein [Streptomyces]|uniref:hypothetical protein n=1 Tax=Streptomyces TaxID=1883 RepID=UPI0022491ED8|nr:hypothetical protein [Streptomyces sp. JHD 1]MCX2968721.1 hypothetical protein [Streptomyces sp. JHD 1]
MLFGEDTDGTGERELQGHVEPELWRELLRRHEELLESLVLWVPDVASAVTGQHGVDARSGPPAR